MVQVGRDLMFNCSGIDIESGFLTKFRLLCFFIEKHSANTHSHSLDTSRYETYFLNIRLSEVSSE